MSKRKLGLFALALFGCFLLGPPKARAVRAMPGCGDVYYTHFSLDGGCFIVRIWTDECGNDLGTTCTDDGDPAPCP